MRSNLESDKFRSNIDPPLFIFGILVSGFCSSSLTPTNKDMIIASYGEREKEKTDFYGI